MADPSGDRVPAAPDAWVDVCADDELWAGEMFSYDVAGRAVLLANVDGVFHAFADRCPHQDVALVEGELSGGVLTCRAHRWEFDLASGRGLNPATARLTRHAVRVEDGRVRVRAVADAEAPSAACDGAGAPDRGIPERSEA